MAIFELILTSDTINEGREKINSAFTQSIGIWTGSTGTDSIIANNFTGNIAGGNYAVAFGNNNQALSNHCVAMGQNTTAVTQNSIVYGENNIVWGADSALIGGQNNYFQSQYGFMGGGVNLLFSGNGFNSDCVIMAGGRDNVVDPIYSKNGVFIGGEGNDFKGSRYGGMGDVGYGCTMIGGEDNKMHTGLYQTMIGGYNNDCGGSYAVMIGSSNCVAGWTTAPAGAPSSFSVVIGSQNSESRGGVIIGGSSNTGNGGIFESSGCIQNGAASVILAANGCDNIGNYNLISGQQNDILDSASNTRCAIIGGINNTMSGSSVGNSAIIASEVCNVASGHDHVLMLGRRAKSVASYEMVMGYATSGLANTSNNTIRFDWQVGSGYWDGTVNLGPADYAEYFEWSDGNLAGEDRVGLFVSLSGENIYAGNSNVIGVVSAQPSVVGDASPHRWNGAYLKDDFDRLVKKLYTEYILNPNLEEDSEEFNKRIWIDEENNIYSEIPDLSNLLGTLYTGDTSQKQYSKENYEKVPNPSYDRKEKYISREDRNEWSAVGLMGKLYVKTSENIVGTKVGVDANGFAINGSDYHVIKTKKAYDGDYGIVQVLIK